MAEVIKCIICEKCENCLSDMHLHQIGCHSIEQLSLALLCCIKSNTANDIFQIQDSNNNHSNTRRSRNKNSELQKELKNCVSAIDKVLPSVTEEGRRKKNPRPRKNSFKQRGFTSINKETSSNSNRNKTIKHEEECLTEVDETKPIQQPQLSSTITTPLKRSLRKKTSCSDNDKILNKKVANTSRKKSQRVSKPNSCSLNQRRRNTTRSNSKILETALKSKQSLKKKNQINIINPSKIKYVLSNYGDQLKEVKQDATWNTAYQNYIASLQFLKEVPIVQDNSFNQSFPTSTNLQNTVNDSSLNQLQIINNAFEMSNSLNAESQNTFKQNIENVYNIVDKIDNELINKTLIESSELIGDLKNIVPEQLVQNLNEDSNIDNLSLNLTNDVKDFIVEFFEEEQNAKSRNPYWEDNMNKYFPSETESSSEIEQFNDGLEKCKEINNNDYNIPLNLIVTKENNRALQTTTYYNPILNECSKVTSNKEFAVCKSTWSADYINKQEETIRLIYDRKCNDISYAYKYKLCCSNCKEEFLNNSTLQAHYIYCKKNLNTSLELDSNEKILHEHLYKDITQKDDTFENIKQNQTSIAQNIYHCHACQKGFDNRTNYCKHMLSHKKTFSEAKYVPCAACGLLLENFNILKNHFHKIQF